MLPPNKKATMSLVNRNDYRAVHSVIQRDKGEVPSAPLDDERFVIGI